MKKLFSLVLTICLLSGLCAAFAEGETQLAPMVKLEDESAFQGNWKATKMIIGEQILDFETALSMMGAEMPTEFSVSGLTLISPKLDGTGNEENECVFEDYALKYEDANGKGTMYILEDGALLMIVEAAGQEMALYCEKLEDAAE